MTRPLASTLLTHRPRARRRCLGVAEPTRGPQGAAPDPLLTADEVAALLKVTKPWVYAQTRAGRIPHVRLGRYVRYRRAAVLAWLAALEHDPHGGDRCTR